jgi:hypothetical protein
MGQNPYWMEQSGGPPPPPPPPMPPGPPKRFSGAGVKVAVALLAVALIAVSAFAFVGYRRTNDLQERLDEQERAQSEQDDPANPLDDLLDDFGGSGELDDLMDDFGGGGDLLGGSNTDLLECLSSGAGGGGLEDLFGGGGGEDLEDLFGGGSQPEAGNPRKLVTSISKQVEKIRELRFKEPVEADFITRAQLGKRVGELFLEEYSRRDADLEARVLEALGAVPPGTNLFQTRKSALQGQVAGFYVPETKELVVLAEENVGPLEKVTLAHELEHALADQQLSLPLGEESDPAAADADLANLALIEGDASLTMQRWSLAHLSLGDQFAMLGDSAQLQQSQEQLEAMPHFLQQQLSFPYLDGLGFVCALQQKGGWAAVDRAYDSPPPSTDQVLFPERYDPGAEPADPRDTGSPGAGWTNSLSGSFGAAELKWLFEAPGGDTSRALPDPRAAAGAWGGGELELWTDGGRSAVGLALAQRRGSNGLCDSITEWYSAAFSDDEESTAGGATLVAEGGAQDAVVTCSGGEVRVGVGPSVSVARALAS